MMPRVFRPSGRVRRAARAGKKRHRALGIQHVDGELVHLRVAGRLHHVIDAAAGDLRHARDDVLTAIVDHVGGPKLQGEFEPPGYDVDADDRAGARRCGPP